MEEKIREKLMELSNYLDNASWTITCATDELYSLKDNLDIKNKNVIKDINALKREMKRDGLYSDEMEEFLDNYMRFYNN